MIGYTKYFLIMVISIFIVGSIEESYSSEGQMPSGETKNNPSKFRKYAGKTAGAVAAVPGAAVGAAAGAVGYGAEGAIRLGRKGAGVGKNKLKYVGPRGSLTEEEQKEREKHNRKISPTRVFAPSATAAGISTGAAGGAAYGAGYGALKGAKKAFTKTNKAISGKK